MLTISQRSQANIVGVTIHKKLTHDDYSQILIPKLDQVIKTHGKVRLLMEFEDNFAGFEVQALVDDAAYGMKHFRNFEKVALINPPIYMRWIMKFSNQITQISCQSFAQNQKDQAWKFIEN